MSRNPKHITPSQGRKKTHLELLRKAVKENKRLKMENHKLKEKMGILNGTNN